MAEGQSTPLRTCSKCDRPKPEAEFKARRNRGGKLGHWCRGCTREYARARYARANPPDNTAFVGHFDNPGREYREVVGFPEYLVGNDGSVWSCYRSLGVGKGKAPSAVWSRLKPDLGELGHMRVTLFLSGRRVRVLVHHLVLRAFVGPRPDGTECCHEDGDPTNNAVANLRWDTPEGNWADRKRHGRARSWSKLATTDPPAIRRLVAGGSAPADVAALFGISDTQVRNIVNFKQWKEVA